MVTRGKEHYHFIGIGGIGMGTLASLMLSKGYPVSGSDVKESTMTQRLTEQGARVSIGHAETNVNGADIVIFSSAVKTDNPEMLKARQSGIPILRRAELLCRLMRNHVAITVAGAHGKTTTTSMIAHMLIQAGLNPTTAVGGISNNGPGNSSLGAGKYFVAELDESDGSFLYFEPHFSVITNIDFEHVDYYGTWEKILGAYEEFIAKTQPSGILIVSGEDKRLTDLVKQSKRRFMTFGLASGQDIWARNIRSSGDGRLKFECMARDKFLGEISLPLWGEHNVRNAAACVGVGMQLSLGFDVIQKSLESYQGVRRRFQFKGESSGIKVVDDYGHHPTEICATLQAARSVPKSRLITVFQPHRYTRTKALKEEFIESLSSSDALVVTDIYAASEPEIEGVSAAAIVEGLKAKGHPQSVYIKKDAIVEYLLNSARAGDMVLTLGAGDIYQTGEEFLSRLKGKANKEK